MSFMYESWEGALWAAVRCLVENSAYPIHEIVKDKELYEKMRSHNATINGALVDYFYRGGK